MIARSTRRQILDNPTKNRVTACRRRVRDYRGAHRSSGKPPTPSPEQAAMTAQFPADSLQVRQLVSLEFSPAIDGKDPAESMVQEVGIT